LNYLQLNPSGIFVGKLIEADALWNVFCLY